MCESRVASLIAALTLGLLLTCDAVGRVELQLLTDEIRGGRVLEVSGDGRVVLGTYSGADGKRAYLWSHDRGFVDLDDPEHAERMHPAVMAFDGTVIAGTLSGEKGPYGDLRTGMRWILDRGTEVAGTLCPPVEITFQKPCTSWARGLSSDGSVVVGTSDYIFGTYIFGLDIRDRGFVWTDDMGMRALQFPEGFTSSWADGVSADGAWVIGSAFNEKEPHRAVRWLAGGGLVELLVPDAYHSIARAVNDDGSAILVNVGDGKGERLVLWTPEGTIALPDLAMHRPTGSGAMTSDGAIIFGIASCIRKSESDQIGTAVAGPMTGRCPGKFFVWDAAHGTRGFASLLADVYGFDLRAGWNSIHITGMSADATVFAGWGERDDGTEAGFLLGLPRRLDET